MGWISTLFDVATLAVVANNSMQSARLEEMAKQVGQVEVIREICRNYVFRISQAKEDMLEFRTAKPLAVTAGLAYLEAELQESGVTPEIFSNISDKEYVAGTLRSLRQSRRELTELLDTDQQQLVNTAAQSLRQYEDLTFVVQTFDDATHLNHLLEEQQAHEKRRPAPRLFGGGREEREWQLRRDQLKTEIAQLGGADAYAQWRARWMSFEQKSKDELARRLSNMEIILQNVFVDRRFIPKIEFIPTSTDGGELSEAGAEMTWKNKSGGALAAVAKPVPDVADDGRVSCPACGYRNSKHRTICKNCRNPLPVK